jgi:hypothetical protein
VRSERFIALAFLSTATALTRNDVSTCVSSIQGSWGELQLELRERSRARLLPTHVPTIREPNTFDRLYPLKYRTRTRAHGVPYKVV